MVGLLKPLDNSDMRIGRDRAFVRIFAAKAIYRVPTSTEEHSSTSPPTLRTDMPFEFPQSPDGRTPYVLTGREPSTNLCVIDVHRQSLGRTIKTIPYPAGIRAVQGR